VALGSDGRGDRTSQRLSFLVAAHRRADLTGLLRAPSWFFVYFVLNAFLLTH
jgi:hypothetical protein